MSQCINPSCLRKNPETNKFCQYCGQKILLRERYRAIKIIGQGGFGKTFLAIDEDKPSQPYCVIKQFFPSVEGEASLNKAKELFEQEAIRLEQLGKHSQIPELYGYFIGEDDRQYLIQEYIPGQNLQQQLEESGVFDESQIIDILSAIIPVLDFLHGQNIIHRDIKPENIIGQIDKRNYFLVDFGAVRHNPSESATMIGTAGYISPEQAGGRITYASDLYSLGVTCLHLTNRKVSENLGNILDKLTEFSLEKRYSSAKEVLEDLDKIRGISTNLEQGQTIIQENSQSVSDIYEKLEDLLKEKEWKKADQETSEIVLNLVKKAGSHLSLTDISNLPEYDLQIIDYLWQKYSNSKFGLTPQFIIANEFNIDQNFSPTKWKQIALKLGWYSESKWLSNHDSLDFSDNAVTGHLPFLFLWQGVWWGGFLENQGDRFLNLMSRLSQISKNV